MRLYVERRDREWSEGGSRDWEREDWYANLRVLCSRDKSEGESESNERKPKCKKDRAGIERERKREEWEWEKEKTRSGSPALLALRRLKARESARTRGPDRVGTSFHPVSCTLLSFSLLFFLLCIFPARLCCKLASSMQVPWNFRYRMRLVSNCSFGSIQ